MKIILGLIISIVSVVFVCLYSKKPKDAKLQDNITNSRCKMGDSFYQLEYDKDMGRSVEYYALFGKSDGDYERGIERKLLPLRRKFFCCT